jgi:hypothetical protein
LYGSKNKLINLKLPTLTFTHSGGAAKDTAKAGAETVVGGVASAGEAVKGKHYNFCGF